MAKIYDKSKMDYASKTSAMEQQMKDGSMLNEDRSAIANMPQEVKITSYARNPSGVEWTKLDDTISGIDNQINQNNRRLRPGSDPKNRSAMPIMPRPNKKSEKIAFALIGTPANMLKKHRATRQTKDDRRLLFEETYRMK